MKAKQTGQEEPRMLKNFIEFLYIFGHFVRVTLTQIASIL